MMDGHAGHGHGLARGGIFVEFLDGVSRPSGRLAYRCRRTGDLARRDGVAVDAATVGVVAQ
jgi:hypothetical protein